MSLISPDEVMRRLELAVTDARKFFGIDPLYRTRLRADIGDRKSAEIGPQSGYMYAPISINMDYYQRSPHLIREDMAHEVAHLMSAEILHVRNRMPDEWQNRSDARAGLLNDAIETLTVRLEHLYLRERPEPSDSAP